MSATNETDNHRKVLPDTIKLNLVSQFKYCIDAIDTAVIIVGEEHSEQYKKFIEILINLKTLDPKWTIETNFYDPGRPWNLALMYENMIRVYILETSAAEFEEANVDDHQGFHNLLVDLRDEDPDWSINGTRRNSSVLVTPEDIGLVKKTT
jgi:hypothetical protein